MNAEQEIEVNEGIIENVAILDLSRMKSPDELKSVKKIINVSLILVPEALSAALASITKINIADIVTVPDDANVKKLVMGTFRLSGEEFNNLEGDPEKDIMVVAMSEFIIESPVTKVGYKEIILCMSDLIAPKESRNVLSKYVSVSMGNTIYYENSIPRIFSGQIGFSKDFFELLEEPIKMVITGKVEIEEDVTREILKEKISEITLSGELTAPKNLIPMLQILTVQNSGRIKEK